MDLATKSKKSNLFVKIICILLSVVCVAGSAYFAEQIAGACYSYEVSYNDFNGKPMQKNVIDSNKVSERIYRDIRYVNTDIALRDKETLKKNLEKYREKFVSDIVAEFVNRKQEFEDYEREDGYYSDEVLYYTNEYFLDYNEGVNDFTFRINITENDKIAFDLYDAEMVAEEADAIFDDFIYTDDFEAYCEYYPADLSVDAAMYAVNKKNGIEFNSEESKPTEESVLAHEYSYVIKDGKITCGKGLEGFFDKPVTRMTGTFNNDCDYYFYVNDDEENYSSYTADIDAAQRTKDVNLLNCTVWASILLLLAILLAVISFVICGNRDRNGKIKLAFIDRVPWDLHLAITAGAQVGLGFLFALLYEVIIGFAYPFEQYLYYCLYAVCAVIWALFIEFMTSFIRLCKSDKKVYQSTLVYLILKYIIIKPCSFIFKKLRAFFTYKPENFKKTLRRILIGYGILNAFFVLVILICAGDGSAGGACFFFAVNIGINIALLVYAVRYMKNLDAIITAAHFRQAPMVDYEKLPNSLKWLVNSLNYTNAELNNAVAQAVKDERMRSELITNVSHDLKTPLTSIITYVDLLKNCDIQDETAKEYIAVLDEKGGKLKRLIEDLIEASKITSGVINIEPMNLNLSELATHAVVEHQQEFIDNGLSLVFKGDKNNITAFADGTKTFRIIENLISNARKYSLRGTRVYADVYETQNFSIFEIKNTSAEALDISPSELTERFVRGDKSRANEGNGLGLSIADNLCKAQNGHLNITIDGDLFKAQVMLPKAKN